MPDKQETPALDRLLEMAKVLPSSDHLAFLVLQHPSKIIHNGKEREGC